jgi:hypothetical protein
MLVSTGSRKRATDLDQLRWTAEARMPVVLRNLLARPAAVPQTTNVVEIGA